MKLPSFVLAIVVVTSAACAPNEPSGGTDSAPTEAASSEAASYLYVWAGDPDENDSDFVAVIDAAPASATYGEILSTVGEILSTVVVGRSAGAHHTEHVMPEGDLLIVNGFRAGQSWVVNVADPLTPTVAATFEGAGPYTSPHSFERMPNGNVLSTFQYLGSDKSLAGGLVELDPMGGFVRGSDAADPADPELHPYSLAINPELDRVLTTTSDMNMAHEGRSVQVWSLGDLELLHTLPLPPGPLGNEHLNPAEPRFLADGSAIVNTFNCGMYRVTDIASDAPQVAFIGSLPRPADAELGNAECSLPVVYENFWVQTSDPTHSIVVFDISDPSQPVQVDELVFDDDVTPHWISLEPDSNRIVLTGGGEALAGMVVLLEIESGTGRIAIVEGFTGSAIPHGVVFSR